MKVQNSSPEGKQERVNVYEMYMCKMRPEAVASSSEAVCMTMHMAV